MDKGGKRTRKIIAEKLVQPNGVLFHNGSLYVAAINKVLRYDNIEANLEEDPDAGRHDGRVQAAAGGAPQLEVPRLRPGQEDLHPGRRAVQSSARSIRRCTARSAATTSTARAWRSSRAACATASASTSIPKTGELWFTDNGRDWAGEEGFEEELNRVPANMIGANFGFPYCHANGQPDPDIKRAEPVRQGRAARRHARRARRGARHALLHRQDVPGGVLRTSILVARHGSWNKTERQRLRRA